MVRRVWTKWMILISIPILVACSQNRFPNLLIAEESMVNTCDYLDTISETSDPGKPITNYKYLYELPIAFLKASMIYVIYIYIGDGLHVPTPLVLWLRPRSLISANMSSSSNLVKGLFAASFKTPAYQRHQVCNLSVKDFQT